MARELFLSMTLNGALGSSFKSAFQGAQGQVQALSRSIRDLQRTPTGQLGAAFDKQKAKLRELGTSLREARGTLQALQAQAAASGGATGTLARQISLAEANVNRLSAAFTRQSNAFRNTVAEARTVSGSIRGLTQDYRSLSASMDRMSAHRGQIMANQHAMQANRSRRSELQGGLMTSVATGASMAFPVKLAMDFEQQVAKVGAVSNASAEDMAALSAQARQLGRDTQFSAVQAAEGQQFLAIAGFKANQVMAAMPAMLDLAAASGADLGRTADIASDMLSGFGMKASELGYVGDVLTKTFTSSNSTLESLGETMKYVGPAAKMCGASISDTAAMAGLLHNVGIKASQAGTAMRAGFLRLAAPPKMAKDALGDLMKVQGAELDELYEMYEGSGNAVDALQQIGMSTKDAAGNLRPMADILEELNVRTSKMGSAEKAEAFKNIFGVEASSAFIALAEQASKTVDENGNRIVDSLGKPTTALRKYMEEVEKSEGTAKTVADKMTATTKGALTRLSSAWQDVGITIGNFFLPAINALANTFTGVAGAISGFTERFPVLSQGIALAVGGLMAFSIVSKASLLAVNLMGGGLLSLRKAFLLARGAALMFGGSVRAALVSTGIGALIVGLGFAINWVYENWETVSGKLGALFKPVGDTISDIADSISDKWAAVTTFFSTIGPAIYSRISPYLVQLRNAFSSAANWVASQWQSVSGALSGVWRTVAEAASNAWDAVTAATAMAANLVLAAWDGTVNFLSGLWDSVSAAASNAWNWICESAREAGATLSEIWGVVSGGLIWIWDSISAAASNAWNWISSSCAPVAEWLTTTWTTISGVLLGVWNGVVSEATACWSGIQDVFGPAIEWFGGITAGIRSVFDSLFGWLKEKFAWVMDTAASIKNFVGGIFGAVVEGTAEATEKGAQAAETNKDVRESARLMAGDPRPIQGRKPAVLPTAPTVSTPPQPQRSKGASQFSSKGAPSISGSGGSRKAKSGGSGGGGGRAKSGGGSSAQAASAQGTTIVRLAGDNKTISTQYIPAGASTGKMKRVSGSSETVSPVTQQKGASISGGGLSGKQITPSPEPQQAQIAAEKPIPVFVTNFPNKSKDGKPAASLTKPVKPIAPKISAPIVSEAKPIAAPQAPTPIIAEKQTAIAPEIVPQTVQPAAAPKISLVAPEKKTPVAPKAPEQAQQKREPESRPLAAFADFLKGKAGSLLSDIAPRIFSPEKKELPQQTAKERPLPVLAEAMQETTTQNEPPVVSFPAPQTREKSAFSLPVVTRSIERAMAMQTEKPVPMLSASGSQATAKKPQPSFLNQVKDGATALFEDVKKSSHSEAPKKILGHMASGAGNLAASAKEGVRSILPTASSIGQKLQAILPKKKEQQPSSMPIEIKFDQNFDIGVNGGGNPEGLRQNLARLRPEFDRMVRQAVTDWQGQNRRTAFVQ